jgi:hypothetical protein
VRLSFRGSLTFNLIKKSEKHHFRLRPSEFS